jgi:hypothetical protein
MQIFITRKKEENEQRVSAYEITLLLLVDKGIYWKDLQSLYCVFISSDLMLHVCGTNLNSFLLFHH